MHAKQVTAIIRRDLMEQVEQQLQGCGVHGLSISPVKGYGEYANFYSRDWLVNHVRVEVFTEAARAEVIAATIMKAAHVGLPGDGIVAIAPVDKIFRIRTQTEAGPDEI